MVPRRRGAEGSCSTRGQALRIAEHWYVILFIVRVMVAEHRVWPGFAALAATGFIWVRYSFVIKPVNYSLAAVSACACIGSDSVLTCASW
jgi:hypothetical protein